MTDDGADAPAPIPDSLAAGGDPRRRFHQGMIVRFRPGSRTGVLRTGNGREIDFALRDLRLLGVEGEVGSLHEGTVVGFDLGWTSRGVRVTMLKVF